MVRVYIAKFTEEKADHSRQSRRAHRLLETVLERDYPQVRAPFLLEKDENGKPFLSECRDIYVNYPTAVPMRPVPWETGLWVWTWRPGENGADGKGL